MKPTKAQLRKIADKVSHHHQLKELFASLDKQIKEGKAEISELVEPFKDQFADGEWLLLHPDTSQRVGCIKEVKNKARLVKTDSDQELTDVEEIKLLEKLPERYRLTSINLTLLNKEQDSKKIAAILVKAGATIEQTSRFDIKP